MNRFSEHLKNLASQGNLRRIPDQNSGLIDLVSNDYLGLGQREEEFREEFLDLYPDAQFTSSASRLLSRRQNYHNRLENRLEQLYGKSALLFNSGYHANTGLISALGSADTLFLVDKMMHASGWDGLFLASGYRKAAFRRFPHNDLEKLESMIIEEKNRDAEKEIIIVTEGIFSMDGDLGKLEKLVELKKRYPGVMLYLDEAHSFGVRGERGLGLAEEKGLIEDVDVLVGTFGKAAASIGAFVVCSPELKDFFINTSRSLIFSTALPPVNAAWSLFMLDKIVKMKPERDHLKTLSSRFAELIEEKTFKKTVSESHIFPLICRSPEAAVYVASFFQGRGCDVLPIRRPTVPSGTERIRMSLSANLKFSDIYSVGEILDEITFH